MKIVQVQTQAEAAGAQRISQMLSEGLMARGHTVRTVFMYRKTDAFDADPTAEYILKEPPRGPIGQLAACLGLIAYMRRERPDAVLSFQHYGNIFGTIAGLLAGTRLRIANQSGAPGKRGGMLVAAWIDHAMGAVGLYRYSIVNSRWTAEQFAGHLPSYRSRVRRIDHGVARSASSIDRRSARQMFGFPGDAQIAVTSGRVTRDKNQRALIEAMALVPHAHLALAGVGPELETLRELASTRGLSDRVHFVGEVPQNRIFEFLAAGDVFVFASRNETFGLSVVEAAIAGLPVISNRLEVLREVLTGGNGTSAVFADAENPQVFAAEIRRVLGDVELQAQLVAAGRGLAEHFAPEAMVARYEELLQGDEAVAARGAEISVS